ncbi:MAG TPA: diguanylate cyclase [Gaiellaceae bacterium]
MPTSWLCPTPLDRARVLETNERIRRPRVLGLMLLVVASAAASPWLGWVPVGATLATLVVGALANRRVPRSRRPELLVLGLITIDAALLGVAAAASGGPTSPMLTLNAVVVTAAAAYFRARGVAVVCGVAITAILAASLVPHPGRLLEHPALPILTIAMVGALAVHQRVGVLAELDHRRRSVVDPLTGALNRHALASRFAELCAQAASTGQPICAIACDLDRFKRVNDLYGHARGDRVLKEAVRAMRSALRGFDSLYRLGGEEFLIVLPRTTIEQGSEVAERVRAAIELARPGGLDVTVSLGVAACTGSDVDYGKVVTHADRALYAAKRRGRNRVVASDVTYAAAS